MEILDLYDNQRRKMTKTFNRDTDEFQDGEHMLAIHVWIVNSKGEYLMQKRVETKKRYPGKWGCTGGAVDTGEDSLIATMRELKEELAIETTEEDLEYLATYRRRHAFVDLWLLKRDVEIEDLKFQVEEVADAKWMTWEEIERMSKNGKIIPSFNDYKDILVRTMNVVLQEDKVEMK